MNEFLTHHRWNHNGITTKEYYDLYLKKENEENCETRGCNNKCNFHSLTKGYYKHCSRSCAITNPDLQNKMKEAKIAKNGFYNNNRKQAKKTCLKKYGVKNVSQIEDIKDKKKETCLKNNGYEHWVGSREHIDWMNDGGAAYCNKFITNPSRPQIELFKLCQEIFPYPVLNYSCLNYSIDIAVPILNLAIEYDGSYWHKNKKYDKQRQEELEEEGWIFLRFIDKIPTKYELLQEWRIL